MISIYERPDSYYGYNRVGDFNGMPIYVGKGIPKDMCAMPTDNGLGIAINDECYIELKKSPRFQEYLEIICNHEIRMGIGHSHEGSRPDEELEVLLYLKDKGLIRHYW